MTLAASIAAALSADDIDAALDLAKNQVKARPTDKDGRHLYIDLLVLLGDYERADSQCSLAATMAPEDTMGFALLRHQLRAMAAREAWFATGAVPEFPHGPSELDQLAVRLGIADRNGAADEATAVLAELETARGECPMLWNGSPVSDFRDLDDRTPHALEVITTGGAYLWVDFAKITNVEIEPIARPRDFAFRRAELTLQDGATAPVLLPAIYHGTGPEPALRLGRETEWVTRPSGITVGQGQRCFLAGDDVVSMHDATTIAEAETAEPRQATHG